MKSRDCHTNLSIQRTALARMHEISLALLDDPDNESLKAEYAALDGSWYEEREIEIDDANIEIDRRRAIEQANQPIIDQLAANDAKALRALFEGDTERIKAHLANQAALRAKLRSPPFSLG